MHHPTQEGCAERKHATPPQHGGLRFRSYVDGEALTEEDPSKPPANGPG
jgi:hypothetical protein